jgi:hypothetical protein
MFQSLATLRAPTSEAVMKKALVGLFAVALTAITIAGPVRAESFPQTREGWLVGFGVGGGTAGVSGGTNREGGIAGSFRVGYAFNPQVSAGLSSSAWSKSESGVTLTFSVGGPTVEFYPVGAPGLVLRAGAGFGSVSASASSSGGTFTASESGFGALAGVGYEFRVLRTFAISPQVDFGYLTIKGDSANYVNFGLGFNWYFIPKK